MTKTEPKEEKKEVVVFDEVWANKNAMIGMSGVDPADIRPPQILLMQKSSEQGDFNDPEGHQPKVGQFFHTGKNIIMDSFDCFFVWAAKGKYIDRNKEGNPEKEQYQAIGLMQDDLTMFGYRFRSSALYSLSPLFTAVVAQKKPMFSLCCHVDTKQLSGQKGTWYIPVVHVIGPEKDTARLIELYTAAKQFDREVKPAPAEEEGADEPINVGNETVRASDIPF